MTAGMLHFTASHFYLAIMPPYLPWHLELVYLSGLAEIAGGAGVLFTGTRRVAGVGLILLTVAVFPANIHMALHPQQFDDFAPWMLYARLPLQGLILWWIWFASLSRPSRGG